MFIFLTKLTSEALCYDQIDKVNESKEKESSDV